jgi:acyl-CoA synthetase (AMP-forming)/AMP-acid ligase II
VDHCRELALTRGGETAYTWLRDGDVEEGSLSFARLDAEARRIAGELQLRGLAGERALLLYSPGLEFIAAFLGCLYAGVVAVPLSTPRNELAAATLLGIARHAAPAILLTDSATSARFSALARLEVLATDLVPPEAAASWRPSTLRPESLAFLQYTSGSTGSPKGVEVTHANLIRNEQMIRAAFGHDGSTVFVGWLPLFHDMGLVGNVLQPLFLGVRCVLMAPHAFVQRPARWLRAVSRYRGTTSGGPNFGYELCVQKVRREELVDLDLSSWKVAYNGSEPVRAETLERFVERFAPAGFRREAFYSCYGLAEASLFVTGGSAREPFVVLDVDGEGLGAGRACPVTASTPGRRRLVGCGRPWLDQRVRIVDPGTRLAVEAGTVGEIWIQGGNVARGYRAPLPEEDDPFRAFLASGEGPYLRTGDLGFERQGELFVTGRIKDLLVLRGQHHYPQDIELVAGSSHPDLRLDHTVAFTLEEERGERLVVLQEVQKERAPLLERGDAASAELGTALAGAMRLALARHFGLQLWRVVLVRPGSLPRTSSGQLRRRLSRTQRSKPHGPTSPTRCHERRAGAVHRGRDPRVDDHLPGAPARPRAPRDRSGEVVRALRPRLVGCGRHERRPRGRAGRPLRHLARVRPPHDRRPGRAPRVPEAGQGRVTPWPRPRSCPVRARGLPGPAAPVPR